MKALRGRARLNQTEFAARYGISVSLLSEIERAARDNYDPETLAVIDMILSWEPGSAERVGHGGEPRLDPAPGLAEIRIAWPRLPPDVQGCIVQIVRVLARLQPPRA